jgi:catechol 2,3-dioxygenase-like lactoylglutathione lyase family enzyme
MMETVDITSTSTPMHPRDIIAELHTQGWHTDTSEDTTATDEESIQADEFVRTRGSFDFTRQSKLRQAFDITSFNHISREVSDVEKSVDFYINILGFQAIPRPAFEVAGVWLWGHGLNFHIVQTCNKEEQKSLRSRRIKYYHEHLPSVDHIAFIAKDCDIVKSLLEEEDIYYREFNDNETGIHQFFFFDPDGNAIEVSNCAPPLGGTRCHVTTSAIEDLCYLETNGYF